LLNLPYFGDIHVFLNRSLSVVDTDISSVYNKLELICFDLLCVQTKLRFFTVYRPPYSDCAAEQYLHLLVECFKQYTEGTQINVIVGDLNCPKIDWNTVSSPCDRISKPLLEFIVEAGFIQFVDFATRGGNILDVILADDDQIITTVGADVPIGHSDYLFINFTVVLSALDCVENCCTNVNTGL